MDINTKERGEKMVDLFDKCQGRQMLRSGGTKRSAMIYALSTSCKVNHIEPIRWLTHAGFTRPFGKTVRKAGAVKNVSP